MSAERDATRAQTDAADGRVSASEAAVRRAALAVDECEVRAPRAGWVDQRFFEPGELAPPGAPLVRLVDLSTVTATFYLPNAELSAARIGGAAVVRADAWPDRAFHGRIVTVGTEAAFTPRNIQTRTDRDRLVYPIEIELDNADAALRPGMPVEVTLARVERASSEEAK